MRWLVIVFLLLGCTAKKTTIEKVVDRDTIQTKSFKYVSQPISTSIVIDDICNEIGKPRAFKQLETSGGNKASVRTENNTLVLDLFTGLSEKKTDTIYKSIYKDRVKEVEKVKFRTPLWLFFALIASILLNLLLLKIKFF